MIRVIKNIKEFIKTNSGELTPRELLTLVKDKLNVGKWSGIVPQTQLDEVNSYKELIKLVYIYHNIKVNFYSFNKNYLDFNKNSDTKEMEVLP